MTNVEWIRVPEATTLSSHTCESFDLDWSRGRKT